MAWVIALYVLNTVFMVSVAIREARRPAIALSCITIGVVFPVVGFLFYVITSKRLRIHRERLTSPDNESDRLPESFGRTAATIAHGLRHLTVNGLRTSRVQVLTNGIETYENLIKSLQSAQRTIDIEYYIYRNDRISRLITDVMIERARAGVGVRFLRDGLGCRQMSRSQIIRMIDAGIECRTFFPLRFPALLSTLNYRDHCKIVVIDGQEAFTGGINVGDEYTGLKPNVGFWRDTHLRVVGEVSADLQAIFDAHWNIASSERMPKTARRRYEEGHGPIDRPGTLPTLGHTTLSQLSAEWGVELATLESADGAQCPDSMPQAYVQTLEGNPGIPTQVIRLAYFICLTQAAQTIDITTPYFVPDSDIIMAIKTAVARGVRVRLLVPRHVDHRIVGAASRTYYGELVEAGVHIYLYGKGVLHAKVMIIDGEIAEVGAANYDMRSFRLDYEVCEMIYSADIARELTQQFERDLDHSIQLHVEDLQQRSGPQRIREQAARLLAQML